jgi:hypothetical protein
MIAPLNETACDYKGFQPISTNKKTPLHKINYLLINSNLVTLLNATKCGLDESFCIWFLKLHGKFGTDKDDTYNVCLFIQTMSKYSDYLFIDVSK